MICNRCGANIHDGSAFCPACGCATAPAQSAPQPAPVYNGYYQQPAAPKSNVSFGKIILENMKSPVVAAAGFFATFLAAVVGIFLSVSTFGYASSYAILVLFGAAFGAAGSYLSLSKARLGSIVLAHAFIFMLVHTIAYMWDTASVFATVIMFLASSYGIVASFLPALPFMEREKTEEE